MTTDSIEQPRLHPIEVVSRRTGLSQDVIRAWEKRYGAVIPARSSTRRRLYTDGEVERLLLLKKATQGGRSIAAVARIGDAELAALVTVDAAAEFHHADPEPSLPASFERDFLEPSLRAVDSSDPTLLRTILTSASVDLGRPALIEGLIVPLMEAVGERWEHGSLQIYQEHAASCVVRSLLDSLVQSDPRHSSSPSLVVGTPAGQIHELGALVVAAMAGALGWRVTHLGCDLPAEEIAACAQRSGARAVALSVSILSRDHDVANEIRTIRDLLPRGVALIVGGRAVAGLEGVLEECGASRVSDIRSLRFELDRLHRGD